MTCTFYCTFNNKFTSAPERRLRAGGPNDGARCAVAAAVPRRALVLALPSSRLERAHSRSRSTRAVNIALHPFRDRPDSYFRRPSVRIDDTLAHRPALRSRVRLDAHPASDLGDLDLLYFLYTRSGTTRHAVRLQWPGVVCRKVRGGLSGTAASWRRLHVTYRRVSYALQAQTFYSMTQPCSAGRLHG